MNYHSIHHRAQVNTLMSKQGIKPPATDYIFTVLQEA
ncbi:MAG: DinB family protein [Bacteroidia bacterium]